MTTIAIAGHDHGTLDVLRYDLLMAIPDHASPQMDDLLQARREIELLKRAVRADFGIYAFTLLNRGL